MHASMVGEAFGKLNCWQPVGDGRRPAGSDNSSQTTYRATPVFLGLETYTQAVKPYP